MQTKDKILLTRSSYVQNIVPLRNAKEYFKYRFKNIYRKKNYQNKSDSLKVYKIMSATIAENRKKGMKTNTFWFFKIILLEMQQRYIPPKLLGKLCPKEPEK